MYYNFRFVGLRHEELLLLKTTVRPRTLILNLFEILSQPRKNGWQYTLENHKHFCMFSYVPYAWLIYLWTRSPLQLPTFPIGFAGRVKRLHTIWTGGFELLLSSTLRLRIVI